MTAGGYNHLRINHGKDMGGWVSAEAVLTGTPLRHGEEKPEATQGPVPKPPPPSSAGPEGGRPAEGVSQAPLTPGWRDRYS